VFELFKDELLKMPDLDSLVSVEREACLENFIVLFLQLSIYKKYK
jgi:hypothetical protein